MELKPCSICGASAYVDETDADLFIGCSVSHCLIGGTWSNDGAGRKLAAKEWNRLWLNARIVDAALAWHQAIEDLNGVQAAEDALRALLRDI